MLWILNICWVAWCLLWRYPLNQSNASFAGRTSNLFCGKTRRVRQLFLSVYAGSFAFTTLFSARSSFLSAAWTLDVHFFLIALHWCIMGNEVPRGAFKIILSESTQDMQPPCFILYIYQTAQWYIKGSEIEA